MMEANRSNLGVKGTCVSADDTLAEIGRLLPMGRQLGVLSFGQREEDPSASDADPQFPGLGGTPGSRERPPSLLISSSQIDKEKVDLNDMTNRERNRADA